MAIRFKIGKEEIKAENLLSLICQFQLLQRLAREIIISQSLAELEYSEQDEKIATKQFREYYQLNNSKAVELYCEQHWLSPEQLADLIKQKFLLEKFKVARWQNAVNKEFLRVQTQLDRAIYSLIRTKDSGIAQELYFRLIENEASFAELAASYSSSPEADTGGLVGPIQLGTIDPVLASAIARSQPGVIQPPLSLGEYFVIVRLERFIPAQLNQATAQHLLDCLFETWLKLELKTQVNFSESIDPDALSCNIL